MPRDRVLIEPDDAADPIKTPTPRNGRQRPPQRREHGKFASERDPPTNGATPPQPPRRPPQPGLIGADRVEGAREIAMVWFGSDDPKSIRKVYHAVKRKRIPCGEDGGKLVASRAKLLAAWDRQSTNKSDGEGDADTDQP
jgi:hypothetical protein